MRINFISLSLHFSYNFESDPRALGAIVVLAANESSYIGV